MCCCKPFLISLTYFRFVLTVFQDPNKSCPCLPLIPDPVAPQLLDLSYFQGQQSWLSEAATSTSTSCSFYTTSFPSSTGTARFCTCGSIMAGINLAVSSTSTMSYCATGDDPPPGWTQILADEMGYPISTTPASPPSTSTPTPTPTPTPPPPTTLAPSTAPRTTSSYCDPYWCGAPFCDRCP